MLDNLAELAREEFAKMEIRKDTYKSLVNSINASKKGNYVFHYSCLVLIVTARIHVKNLYYVICIGE